MDKVHHQENVLLVFQKIIEQESKTSTYKFALLRAVIDLITAQSPHIEERTDHFSIPVFLISDKWIFYYWDLISHSYAQIHSGRKLAFEDQLIKIRENQQFKSYWEFQREFQKIDYLAEVKKEFISLAKLLNNTITKNPVKYIGSSLGLGHHALFQLDKNNNSSKKTIKGYFDLLQNSPQIKISKTYFEGLKKYGGLLSGTNSILMNWVDFMNKQQPTLAKRNEDLVDDVKSPYLRRSPLNLLLQSDTIDRQTETIRKFWTLKLRNGESVVCTWSGERIKKESDLAIDHAIPFSVLFNNDYWNLVPAKNNVNSKKSDKILSNQQLSNSKSRLNSIWKEYQTTLELAPIFVAQCQISLTKETEISFENIFQRISKINQGLIENRGMEEWTV